MLKSLYIKNYALIDELNVSFKQGLTAITGETGAGKSIIIGAIQLATGARADSKIMRDADQKCIIEAIFQCPLPLQQKIKNEFDLEDCDEILLRREIHPSGKSRSFINDSPRLLTELESIGSELISIHQQFDHLDFYDKKFQLKILDDYAGHWDSLNSYQHAFRTYQELIQKKNKLEEMQIRVLREKEFMEFQYRELAAAKLKPAELNDLEQELALVSKAEDLNHYCRMIHESFSGEQGIVDKLTESMAQLRPLLLNTKLQSVYDRMESIKLDISEIARDLEHIADQSEADPIRLKEISQRVDLINNLLKKHRLVTTEDLLRYQDELETTLQRLDESSEELETLEKTIEEKKSVLLKWAKELHQQRSKVKIELQEKTTDLLKKLGMPYARYEIQLNEEGQLNETGMDKVDFLFSANKGNALKSLKDQSSGGELARFNLAVKSLVSSRQQTTCLVFDEIDTGVSGQIALQMGSLLRQIAASQQVICITHSPQVASRAKQHSYVYKEHESNSSQTRLRSLTENERVIELAKMLSGEPPSKAALSNAEELLKHSDH